MINHNQFLVLKRLAKKPYVISWNTVPRTRINSATLKALERRKLIAIFCESEYCAWDITKKGRAFLKVFKIST
jgi:hypothetical protein